MLKRILCLALVVALLGGSALALELKKGDKGLDALYLQLRLNHLGYDVGTADGDYGGKTVKAVTAFQEAAGLEATGAVDEATWEALFNETVRLHISVGSGFDVKSYYVRYNLPAPFTTLERQEGESGKPDHGILECSGINCTVFPNAAGSLDAFDSQIKQEFQTEYENTFAPQYKGSDYRVTDEERFEINGKPASIIGSRCDFVNGETLTHYNYAGCVELDECNGTQIHLVAVMIYNAPKDFEMLGVDHMKAVLAGARCDRDVLYEYKAGEADRMAAAGIKLELPEFQPVDDGTSVSGMVYHIQKYVDPAADGASGELDGKTCVSLYYGAKLMKWYETMVAAGNNPNDVIKEARMSLTVAAMDFDLMHAFPEVKGQFAASLDAAKLALTDDAAPCLTALGIDAPNWTEAELNAMKDGLMGVFDIVIERLEESDS